MRTKPNLPTEPSKTLLSLFVQNAVGKFWNPNQTVGEVTLQDNAAGLVRLDGEEGGGENAIIKEMLQD